jgi:hypothetical protein
MVLSGGSIACAPFTGPGVNSTAERAHAEVLDFVVERLGEHFHRELRAVVKCAQRKAHRRVLCMRKQQRERPGNCRTRLGTIHSSRCRSVNKNEVHAQRNRATRVRERGGLRAMVRGHEERTDRPSILRRGASDTRTFGGAPKPARSFNPVFGSGPRVRKFHTLPEQAISGEEFRLGSPDSRYNPRESPTRAAKERS